MFPILVYSVVHANLKYLHRILCFAYFFGTDSGALSGEGTYYLTTMTAAATWVCCLQRRDDGVNGEINFEVVTKGMERLAMRQDEAEVDDAIDMLRDFIDSNKHFEDTVNAIL